MKTKIITSLLTVTILLSAAVLVSLGTIGDAHATKAHVTYVKMYGLKTAHIVCGDQLCSEVGQSSAGTGSQAKQQSQYNGMK